MPKTKTHYFKGVRFLIHKKHKVNGNIYGGGGGGIFKHLNGALFKSPIPNF